MSAKALLSASVSAPPAVYVEDVFSTYLYTGNGSTQTITNGIDLAGEGGLVWTKNRTDASNHFLFDSTRNNAYYLQSNSTGAQDTLGSGYNLVFNSNGFTDALVNQIYNGVGNASWTFRKAAKFFDVVTYTGTGSARTVAHNLGSVPGCMIVKRLDGAEAWRVYHQSVGNNKNLVLNTTVESSLDYGDNWNNTSPTSTQFSLGPGVGVNQSGATYVAYLFASNAGGFGDSGSDSVISCGSYTGNGSSTGPTVTLGWEPQWLLVKVAAGASGTWCLVDNMRGVTASASVQQLSPNSTSSEVSETGVAFTSTGFSVNTTSSVYNYIGATYIYIAIRRGPMKTPESGTEVFSAQTFTGTGTNSRVFTGVGFPLDLLMLGSRDAVAFSYFATVDRLRGPLPKLQINSTGGDQFNNSSYFTSTIDSMDGYTGGTADFNQINISGGTRVQYLFRRAPGFFDVVAYTGNNASSQSVSHNLGAIPEMMIVKARNSSTADPSWGTYHQALGNTKAVRLNQNLSALTGSQYWNDTSPTSTVFTVGDANAFNKSGDTFIAYLFATAPGVSKVGSYTGTGTTLSIDCGFTAGARFILIKRTDDNGDWYVWDTARGIISGDDPYLLLNSSAAEVTGTDYIDPLASGFQISSTAPAAINASGGSFIFLAIA
jgi:hypothetical protein